MTEHFTLTLETCRLIYIFAASVIVLFIALFTWVIVLTRGNKALRKRCDAMITANKNNSNLRKIEIEALEAADRIIDSEIKALQKHYLSDKLLSPEHLTSDSLKTILMQNETILAGMERIEKWMETKYPINKNKRQ
jgi:hypothetical protein